MDKTENFFHARPATAMRPLLGITVLVVEDSRFACEALRLLCLRSGARIRRADSLYAAQQHLKVYRPCVLIVDAGLPDGDGTTLIDNLTQATPRIDVILGTSGDPERKADVMAAGADDFLEKPITSLGEFQNRILQFLPANRQPPGPRLVNDEVVQPDIIAFHDDLSHVAQVLSDDQSGEIVDYVTQFLGGVARSVSDDELVCVVTQLAKRRDAGDPLAPAITDLHDIVQRRLSTSGPFGVVTGSDHVAQDAVRSAR
ncbi:response regulator [Yoonia sp. 208BN28-4]|uniref:response regulator n=1 Tax=Yoonia sp. 208BN28-4 TaxID=3126505 RepID=UPI0030B2BD69